MGALSFINNCEDFSSWSITNLSLEEVLIVKDCVLVSPCPDLIPDHLAMYFRAGVRLEVESLRVETSARAGGCVASRSDFGVGGER